jgi:hypothetical protein
VLDGIHVSSGRKLLARQLRRAFGVEDVDALQHLVRGCAQPGGAAARVLDGLPGFITAVLGVYDQADRDLELRRRSLELSSEELNAANERLRGEARAQAVAIGALHASRAARPSFADCRRCPTTGIGSRMRTCALPA